MDKKPAAKKTVKKKEPVKPDLSGEIDVFHIMTEGNKVVTSMLRKALGIGMSKKASNFPTNSGDIDSILAAMETYPQFIKLENMKGYCRVWEAVIKHWERIMELYAQEDRKGLARFLKELASPYLGVSHTYDYSSSIYE